MQNARFEWIEEGPPTMSKPMAGWYPDPADASRCTYWDGLTWTASVVFHEGDTNESEQAGPEGPLGSCRAELPLVESHPFRARRLDRTQVGFEWCTPIEFVCVVSVALGLVAATAFGLGGGLLAFILAACLLWQYPSLLSQQDVVLRAWPDGGIELRGAGWRWDGDLGSLTSVHKSKRGWRLRAGLTVLTVPFQALDTSEAGHFAQLLDAPSPPVPRRIDYPSTSTSTLPYREPVHTGLVYRGPYFCLVASAIAIWFGAINWILSPRAGVRAAALAAAGAGLYLTGAVVGDVRRLCRDSTTRIDVLRDRVRVFDERSSFTILGSALRRVRPGDPVVTIGMKGTRQVMIVPAEGFVSEAHRHDFASAVQRLSGGSPPRVPPPARSKAPYPQPRRKLRFRTPPGNA